MFWILLAAILLFCAVIEAAVTNVFVNPPPAVAHFDLSGNPEYLIGETVNLKWATDFKQANLVVRQLNASSGNAIASGSTYVKKNLSQKQTSLDWRVVSFNTDLDLSNVFYFIFADTSDSNNNQTDASRIAVQQKTQFVSHWFNVTRNSGSSSTGKNNNNQNELGYPAKVGIGVGAGVGCAFLIALGAAIWYFRRRIKAIAPKSQAAYDSASAAATTATATEDDASKAAKPPVSELEAATHKNDTDRQPPVEMHANGLVEMPAERGAELPNQQQEIRYELL